MKVDFTKAFDKQFEKLTRQRQAKAREAIMLYLQDTMTSSLRIHALKGEWKRVSINKRWRRLTSTFQSDRR